MDRLLGNKELFQCRWVFQCPIKRSRLWKLPEDNEQNPYRRQTHKASMNMHSNNKYDDTYWMVSEICEPFWVWSNLIVVQNGPPEVIRETPWMMEGPFNAKFSPLWRRNCEQNYLFDAVDHLVWQPWRVCLFWRGRLMPVALSAETKRPRTSQKVLLSRWRWIWSDSLFERCTIVSLMRGHFIA